MQQIINDPLLGTIKYSQEYNCYEGKIANSNNEIIKFSFDVDNNLPEVLAVTRHVIKQLQERFFDFKLYAAEKLLDLYNNIWSEDEIIEGEEFAHRINLELVIIHHDGSAAIYYHDGNLFAGHCIVISLNSQGELEDADIAG